MARIMKKFMKMMLSSSFIALLGLQTVSARAKKPNQLMLNRKNFQKVVDGKKTDLYFLKNKNGMEVAITNYGGRVVGILAPDRHGNFADVALGYDNIDGYLNGYKNNKVYYFGAIIGRYANRIAKGKFTLDGGEYQLPINDGVNSLHGGFKGFFCKVWNAKQLDAHNLLLTYDSPNMEEGYPGDLKVQVLYTLTADNSLKIEYTAITNRPTVINLTNHTYFNLNGAGNGNIYDNEMYINADSFTPIDNTMIPTGKIESVKGTPFDFTKPTAIGKRINDKNDQQIKYSKGYDDNWVLNKKQPYALSLAASVYDPKNGRVLDVYTTEPGIQFYSGNFLDGVVGKYGKKYDYRTAFTLETQHYPDAPNHPNFPSTVLNPHHIFHSITVYHFTTK